jgi:hypothetical protein
MVLFTCVLFINKPYLILTYPMKMLTIILQLQLLQPKLYQCIWNRIKKNNHSDVHWFLHLKLSLLSIIMTFEIILNTKILKIIKINLYYIFNTWKTIPCLMNYENLAITIQNMFTLKLRLVNRYYTFRKSQTYILYMKNVNYNYFISPNKETQIIPLICFLLQKMKIMKMKGGCVPYNFQNCIKFCQNILLL